LKVQIGGTYRFELPLPSLARDDSDSDGGVDGDNDDDRIVYVDEVCDSVGLGPLLRALDRINGLDTEILSGDPAIAHMPEFSDELPDNDRSRKAK
jgi:hypothetical protein